MIGIHSIGSYVPDVFVDNMSRCQQFKKSPEFIHEKIGFLNLPRKSKKMETSDMCVAAFHNLQQQVGINPGEVDCILVCTQNPDGYGLPHTAAVVHGKLDFPSHTAAIDISLGCSGYVYSLNMLIHFMAGNNMRKGLLFTADPYSKVLDPEDYITELLFGDAATCTLIAPNPLFIMGKAKFSTDGNKHEAIIVDNETRTLSMDGKRVFNFSMRTVPQEIRECIYINNLSINDIDIFLLHQASKYIVENIRRQMNISEDKLPFLASMNGNTVSSTIPLMLKNILNSQVKLILLSGFGVGLSCATTILKK